MSITIHVEDLSGYLQKRVAVEPTDVPIIFIMGYDDVPMTVRASCRILDETVQR